MRKWKPIDTAPKDGTYIELCWMDDLSRPNDVCLMMWNSEQKNALFPGKVGMWVTSCGSFTWNDDGGGGPTHWANVN